jgi:hypothetical protein
LYMAKKMVLCLSITRQTITKKIYWSLKQYDKTL